jgi:hypothetical protein
MIPLRATAATLTLCLLCPGAGLLACGDKFLVLSRGTRFERAPSARKHAAILVYAAPSSRMTDVMSRLSVDAMLRKAGYQPQSVASADQFESELRRGGWDLVLVDLADAPAVAARAGGGAAPLVVPVALGATRTEVSLAKRRFARVIAAPTRGQAFVDAVDDALALRQKTRTARAGAEAR